MQPADPHILHPDHAPTPFTADEIRTGCPAGRTVTMAVDGLYAVTAIFELHGERSPGLSASLLP